MPDTFTLINAVTVGSGGAATIDFTSIPQTFTDLVLKLSPRSTASTEATGIFISLNGSTSSFTTRYFNGFYNGGFPPESGTGARILGISTTLTSNTFSNIEAYFANYTSSANKAISGESVSETNGSESYKTIVGNLWANNAAITSISLTLGSGNFAQHSTAYLYGIKKD